jgi:hypothetical protein
LRFEQGTSAAEGRDDGFAGDFFGGSHKGGAVFGGEIFEFGGALIKRCHEDILHRWTGEEAIELRDRGIQDEFRRQETAGGALLGLGDAFAKLPGDKLEPGKVVLDVALVADRVCLGKEVDQAYLQSAELLEDKMVVLERFRLHDLVELPFEHRRGDTLIRIKPGAVEFLELGEATLSHCNPGGACLFRDRRELAVERVLLGSGKELGTSGLAGVGAHPIGGERIGEAVESGVGREQRRNGERNDQANQSEFWLHENGRRLTGKPNDFKNVN